MSDESLRTALTHALTMAALDDHTRPTVMGQRTIRPEVRVSDVVAAVLPVVSESLSRLSSLETAIEALADEWDAQWRKSNGLDERSTITHPFANLVRALLPVGESLPGSGEGNG
jgi:hypothetical protein